MSDLASNVRWIICGILTYSTADFEVGIAPIPQISKETGAVIQQGTNVVVLKQNKSHEEVYAAYEFAKFLGTYEGNLSLQQQLLIYQFVNQLLTLMNIKTT